MTTYREYQNQIEELQRKAATARKEEIGTTIRVIARQAQRRRGRSSQTTRSVLGIRRFIK